MLLVRRRDSGNCELPGGRVELGKSATAAAEREAAEESSVTIEVIRLAGVYTDPGHSAGRWAGRGSTEIAAIWLNIGEIRHGG